ncbi:DUF512 domain-containing protein [Parasporobacterium paucivorans]|uniref:Putative radical SAM enzyme, TIGR03279 family n=1 Tax=Parasporobacterium paucivorans DSM 15970 TaxID=1122934 RepID=A0A1M6A087_9FIRM|nr:DUF512 domain-containing protein [Parasporobacterium paucivorans]SHI29937.1 putative radical SAM enzyme, TIGR03279 family [Parasporobacterium paucivorans DSM 15970]
MSKKGHFICTVVPGSIAEELGIEPGDRLISVNDKEVEDVFDYRFLIDDEYIEILVAKPDGDEWIFEVEKEPGEDLGLDFDSGLMDDYRSCRNKCMFCFIDQLPAGMRDTLYFKDDDSRLSFLQGNYITLTNMKDEDIERIIKYHLEPINISVHTTNPELRCRMLHNRFAGDSLKHLKTLFDAGIHMNLQIVLCKGVNDGDELEQTIKNLSGFIPLAESLSVVPAGLTKFRDGLEKLDAFESEDARNVIATIEKWKNKLYNEQGTHFVHASDEWYILAGRDFPSEENYDGYPQLENGVGMMRLLIEEFTAALNEASPDNCVRKLSIATGMSAAPYMCRLMESLQTKFPYTSVKVYAIRNDFFGESITVSGLVTGQDLISQLKGLESADNLLLPVNMLRSGEDVFLDDVSIRGVEEALNTEITVVDTSGENLLQAVLSNRKYSGNNKNTGVYRRLYDDRKRGDTYE